MCGCIFLWSSAELFVGPEPQANHQLNHLLSLDVSPCYIIVVLFNCILWNAEKVLKQFGYLTDTFPQVNVQGWMIAAAP